MENRFKVINVSPRGFCKGVYNAIELAKQTRLDFPNEKITILGELVHNKDVVNGLKALHIDTIESKGKQRIDLLDEVSEGIIIFSAHGVSPLVEMKAKNKGLKTINASCGDVLKTQDLIKNYLNEGYEVFYIGQKDHPEAEASLELDLNRVHLIQIGSEIPRVNVNKIFVTNQTTMSMLDIKNTLESIQLLYPFAILSNEICNATRLRQEAILKLSSSVDGIVIIGDKNSNNTKMLAKIAQNKSIKTIIEIQNLSELDPDQLDLCHEIAITAGASTPKFIIDEIVNFVNAYSIDSNINKQDHLIHPFI
jgi:4-hydroxy-3-methylbut-2-en-1-yl diphosphate reductase